MDQYSLEGKNDCSTLAGAAKTLVISMLSERVVLRVLVMLSEWAAAISTNLPDDRRVLEMKTKLEADGKL